VEDDQKTVREIESEGVYFDMDGNGFKEKMLTWTDPNQWMVVKDLNGDGIINSGREFLNFASNGFYLSRHPELVSGSQLVDYVRNEGDAMNNFNFKNERGGRRCRSYKQKMNSHYWL
jgi:hypothetical protein